ERGLPARSLAWTTATAGDLPAIGMTLARTRRVQDLIGQLESHISPAQNLVVGDRDGGVLFTAIGRVPIRGAGDGQLPSPAWDPAYHWQGLHPQISNRTVINPDADMFVTANHRIEGETGDGRAPVPGAEFDTPYRAHRIFELLLARDQWSPDDIAAVQSDVVSAYALHMTEMLAGDYDGTAASAYGMLASWDGTMAGAGAPALFTLLEQHLREAVFDETAAHGVGRIASRWRLVHVLSGAARHDWFDDESTTNVETREEILSAALSGAWAEANALWGEDPEGWDYGAIHRLHLDNPLGSVPLLGGWFNRGPVPFPGSATTVAAFGGSAGDAWQRIAYGPSMRWVSSLADPDGSLAIMPLGQSGHPADPHYDDQLEAYRSGGMRPVRWSPEAAAAAAVSSLTLVPADSPAS
ncbi:MAG: hypothetical protein GWN71_03885, partial [Gammaproteobacteria bacterium]|nr:hypothetical protein [Gammaproteobacteria bacterium]